MVSKKVLIVAPHPDDETLGCAGTLLKLKDQGAEIYWMILTNVFENQGYSEERIKSRQEEIEQVAKLLGFKETIKLDFPTAQLDQVPSQDLIERIGNVFNEIQPDTIFVPNRSDVHSDHRIAFHAIMSCTKNFRFPFVKRVIMYETISETEFASPEEAEVFVPNLYFDISSYIDKKIDAMKLYSSEMDEHPFPRSEKNIRALATYRGATMNAEYAEAFMSLKEIWE